MQFDTGSLSASLLRNVAAAMIVAVATTGCFEEEDKLTEDPVAVVNEAPQIQVKPGRSDRHRWHCGPGHAHGERPGRRHAHVPIESKPAWANFDSSNGTLSGTPAATDVGTYGGIVISVSDGPNTTRGPSLRIVVEAGPTPPPPPPNTPPSISGSPGTSVTEGQAYSFTPSASDPDGQAR